MITLVSTNDLADFVRRRRDELGISQGVLSERTGVSSGWIGRLETNTLGGKPKPETLEKLAKGLRVEPAVLEAVLKGGSTPLPVRTELPAFETGRHPATPDERALMDEAETRGISFDTFGIPGFWDRPEDDPDREDAFHHLRRMIQIDKRIRGA